MVYEIFLQSNLLRAATGRSVQSDLLRGENIYVSPIYTSIEIKWNYSRGSKAFGRSFEQLSTRAVLVLIRRRRLCPGQALSRNRNTKFGFTRSSRTDLGEVGRKHKCDEGFVFRISQQTLPLKYTNIKIKIQIGFLPALRLPDLQCWHRPNAKLPESQHAGTCARCA